MYLLYMKNVYVHVCCIRLFCNCSVWFHLYFFVVCQGLIEKRQKQVDEFNELRSRKLKELEEKKRKFIGCKFLSWHLLILMAVCWLDYIYESICTLRANNMSIPTYRHSG